MLIVRHSGYFMGCDRLREIFQGHANGNFPRQIDCERKKFHRKTIGFFGYVLWPVAYRVTKRTKSL